jgi:hypothetical protein
MIKSIVLGMYEDCNTLVRKNLLSCIRHDDDRVIKIKSDAEGALVMHCKLTGTIADFIEIESAYKDILGIIIGINNATEYLGYNLNSLSSRIRKAKSEAGSEADAEKVVKKSIDAIDKELKHVIKTMGWTPEYARMVLFGRK